MSVKNGAVPNEESKTAFSVLSAHFPEPGEKLKTLEFLDAAAGVVSLVEKLGKIFSPVVNDINGNIKKLLESYNKDPETNEYLEDMILKEQIEGDNSRGIATDALLWLRRALHFKSIFFQLIIMDTDSQRLVQDLTPFIKRAYSESLERYHGWLGSQLFHVISRFIPNRKSLLCTLALNRNDKEEEVIRDMKQYNLRLSRCVSKLRQFYMDHHLEPI
ncbi:unnamed protein product [Ceutorhynchus assimilis]|uniref:Glycolipid transfer protein domain-containing protein n=1 Tax=Ceutorhynchus assimilis TaxID=467358 RepID=A0A9N9MNF8_9CUCU|nr:unnamed protein product [Ceutorhynchus assimilis]